MNNSFIIVVYQGMKCYFSMMKPNLSKSFFKVLFATRMASFTITFSPSARADAAAEKLLEGVRLVATLHHGKLDGHIRKKGKRTPLLLTMKGQDITFQYFTDKKWSGFHMQLKQGQAKLFETVQGKATPLPSKKIGAAIIGSDVTYEDLSLRFLYWKDAKIEGAEKIKMQQCHKIRLNNPGNDGRYKTVYIWVHQKFGALMSVAGYDAKGQLLKRFHVTDLMTVGKDKVQTLKKMNVETYKPGTNKVIGITYLEFKEPKKAIRQGL